MPEIDPLHRPIPFPDLPTTRSVTPKLVITLLALALLFGLGASFGGPRALHWWKNRDAEKLSEQARAKLDEGDWQGASKLAIEAYRKVPGNLNAVRVLATILDQTTDGADRAVFFWQQLASSPKATLEDRAALGSALLRMGRHGEARVVLERIPPAARSRRVVAELEASVLRYEGRIQEAEAKLRAAYQADSSNPDSRFKLNVLDLTSPFPEVQERAEKEIWNIAREGGTSSVNAMTVLAARPSLTSPKAGELRELVNKAQRIQERHRYTILSGCLRAAPGDKVKIITEESARQEGRLVEETTTYLNWLLQNGDPDRVLANLSGDTATRSQELFMIFVKAMEGSKRLDELRLFIRKSPSLPVSPTQRALILARCAHGMMAPVLQIRAHLQEATKHASSSVDRSELIGVGTTADSYGQTDIALEAFTILSEQPQFRIAMLDRVLQIQYRERNLNGMLKTVQLCLEEKPGLSPYLETSCYLRLLAGYQMEAADAEARHIGKAGDTPTPVVRFLRVFAAYRLADFSLAAQEAREVDVAKLPPGQRAVLSGILRACGNTSAAFRLAEKIPESLLLKEESAFLHAAL